MEIIDNIISIPIDSSNKKDKYILLAKLTCECMGFQFRNSCKHIKRAQDALEREFIKN